MTRLFMVFMLTVLLSMRIMNAATHYVVPPGTVGVIPVNPYTNWTTAGTNIIEVVNAAMTNTAPMHIWVSNGTYYLTNHVYVNNAVTIQSVNGRDMTIVDGNCPNTTNRCFYLDHAGAVLDGFTITNGMENQLGGGILVTNGIVTNCLIVDNQLTNSGGSYGAGVLIYYGTLTDSIVMRNRGARYGSGAIVMLSEGSIRNCVFSQNTNNPSFGASVEVWGHSTISNSVISNNYGVGLIINQSRAYDCTIIGNSAAGVRALSTGTLIRNSLIANNGKAGTWSGDMPGLVFWNNAAGCVENCTVAGNYVGLAVTGLTAVATVINTIITDSGSGTNWMVNTAYFTNCCTTPLPVGGNGNITTTPVFVNKDAGNWRLAANSPCVNAGMNQDWMTNAVDLDDRQRIRYGTVDMGAYESIWAGSLYCIH